MPKIDQLAEKKLQLTLSVSLHAPNNDIRSGMMPVNDAYPVEVLMQAVRRYQETTGRRVSFEYSMVRGVNDSDACAKQLADLIRGMALTSTSSPSTRWTAALFGYRRRHVRRFQQKLESSASTHRPPPSGQRDQRRLRPAPPRRDERQSLRRRIL